MNNQDHDGRKGEALEPGNPKMRALLNGPNMFDPEVCPSCELEVGHLSDCPTVLADLQQKLNTLQLERDEAIRERRDLEKQLIEIAKRSCRCGCGNPSDECLNAWREEREAAYEQRDQTLTKLSESEAREAVYVEALERIKGNCGYWSAPTTCFTHQTSSKDICRTCTARQALSPTPNKAQKILEVVEKAKAWAKYAIKTPAMGEAHPERLLREAIESLIQEGG